ncbi:hypothetical protein RhiJN_14419 [Ceratobasidium sp. AG-Ba]|nr:hypothetical protein RhiJN_14419 [Ceratobasidium sp. AG-Ba]QRW14967.1 hypothetical protein RhiLY_13966 [Ceratobasidium sp. AG-Ba]
MAYFRLERNPAEKGVGLLGGKTTPASDTIRMNFNLDSLRQTESAAVRGYFTFNPEDNAPKPIMLKHILEIYEYLVQASDRYKLLGTNCRWFCYGFLECLRECKPCFGGHWSPCAKKESPKQDTQAAIRAKDQYLREKHAECCYLRPRGDSIMSALVAEAVNIGTAVTNMVEITNQVHAAQPANTDPNVVYSTAGPSTPPSKSTLPPGGGMQYMPNNIVSPPVASGLSGSMDGGSMGFPETIARPGHPYPTVHPQRQPGSRTSWVPQSNFEMHAPQQPLRTTTSGHSSHSSVHYEGYAPNPHPWDTCSCAECLTRKFDRTPRSSFVPERSFSSQPPQGHQPHYNGQILPLHTAGGFRHVHHPRRPVPPHPTYLYDIPEGIPPEYDIQQHGRPVPTAVQPPHCCSNCGHHPIPANVPGHQNTFTQSHGPASVAYTQGLSTDHPGFGYTNNPGSQTIHTEMRPMQPQPTRWFTQDSTTGVPPRTESPSQMSQISPDEEAIYTRGYFGHGRGMPEPVPYHQAPNLPEGLI